MKLGVTATFLCALSSQVVAEPRCVCDYHADDGYWEAICKSPPLADLWERAAIGPIPGGLVVIAGVLFHGAWAVLALVTYRIEIASRRERQSLIAMG